MSQETPLVQEKTYSVIVNKIPRSSPIISAKPNFGELGSLHLDLIENKLKLKPGLPLIPPPEPERKEKKEKKDKKDEPLKEEEKIVPPEPDTEPKEAEHSGGQPDLLFVDESDDEGDDEKEKLPPEEPPKEEGNKEEPPKPPPLDDEESESESESEDEEIPPEERLTEEQKEEQEKDELLWKFRLLKKKHPKHIDIIPDFDEHSDIVAMRRKYQMTVKELHMEGKLFEYRRMMFMGGIATEAFMKNILGWDFEGFSEVQNPHDYDALLVELGEKSYTNFTSYLPVEIRIVIAFVMNAAIFYIFKTMGTKVTSDELFEMIASLGGERLAEFLRKATGKNKEKKEEVPDKPAKRRMRGPSLKAEDVRKMSLGKED